MKTKNCTLEDINVLVKNSKTWRTINEGIWENNDNTFGVLLIKRFWIPLPCWLVHYVFQRSAESEKWTEYNATYFLKKNALNRIYQIIELSTEK